VALVVVAGRLVVMEEDANFRAQVGAVVVVCLGNMSTQ
jgi:hypothetical protein